jgi:hypothetical protein
LSAVETAATAAQGELQQARGEIQQNVRDLQAAQAAIGREEAARLAAEAAKTTAETDVRNLQGQLTQAGVRINADGQTIRDQVQKIARLTSDLTNAEAYIARYDQRDAQHAQSVNHWQGRARLVESWKVAAPMLCKAAVLVTGVVIGAGLGIKAATAAAAVGTTAVVMMLGGAAGGFIVGKSIINHFTNTQPATHYVGRTRKIAGGVLQFALCVGLLGYAINKGYFNSLTANSPGLQGVASVTQSLDRLAGKVAIGSSGVIDSLSGSAPDQGAVTGAANLTQGRGVAAPAQSNAAVTTVAPGALYTVSPQTPMYNNEAKAGTIYTFSNHDPFLAQGAMRNGLAYGYAVKPDHTQVPGWVDMRKLTIRNQQNSMNIRGYNKVTLSAKAHSFG